MTEKAYKIDIENAALKALKKLDKGTKRRVKEAIDSLATNPRPDGVRKLTDKDGLYRGGVIAPQGLFALTTNATADDDVGKTL